MRLPSPTCVGPWDILVEHAKILRFGCIFACFRLLQYSCLYRLNNPFTTTFIYYWIIIFPWCIFLLHWITCIRLCCIVLFFFLLSQFDSCVYLFCLLGWAETAPCTTTSMTEFLKAQLNAKFSAVNAGADCASLSSCQADCHDTLYDTSVVATATYKCPSSGVGDPVDVGKDCSPRRNHLFLIFVWQGFMCIRQKVISRSLRAIPGRWTHAVCVCVCVGPENW